jgi:hypothetical protein
METLDRRGMLGFVLGGAAIATAGLALVPLAAQAMPLALGADRAADLAAKSEGLVDKARVVVVAPRRRRRVCWWRRGRRVCAWR